MGTVTLEVPTSGTVVTAGLHAANYADIQAALNGGLDANNLADAAVTRAKLATITRKAQPTWVQTTSPGFFVDGSSITATFVFVIPDDYVSGDITVKVLLYSTAAGNAFRMSRNVDRHRETVAVSNIEAGVASTLTMPAGANTSALYSFAVASTAFTTGDSIYMNIQRVGADGADTNTGTGVISGIWFEYTGRS